MSHPTCPDFWWFRTSPQDMMKSMPEHMKETCCCMVAKWLVAVMIDDGRPGNIRELALDMWGSLGRLANAWLCKFLVSPAASGLFQTSAPSSKHILFRAYHRQVEMVLLVWAELKVFRYLLIVDSSISRWQLSFREDLLTVSLFKDFPSTSLVCPSS